MHGLIIYPLVKEWAINFTLSSRHKKINMIIYKIHNDHKIKIKPVPQGMQNFDVDPSQFLLD